MSLPNRSTKLKVAFGYILLTALLFISIGYYKNGKEKWHGNYVNGKREGYFTLQLREGGVAVVPKGYFPVLQSRVFCHRLSFYVRLPCISVLISWLS